MKSKGSRTEQITAICLSGRNLLGVGIMKSTKSLIGLILAMLVFSARGALAVPIFQTYITGATTDTMEPDEDTWVVTDSSFDLIVSGAYGPWTTSLTDVTLLISVPQGETGTISITGADQPILLTETNAAADDYFNPDVDAVLDLLANESGNSAGYDAYSDKEFLPGSTEFNNHYPFKEDLSNFLLYDLGDFGKTSNAVSNYSTEGQIAYNIADGEEKVYSVLVTGFSTVHFDVYGYVQRGDSSLDGSAWAINPASHDAAYMVPEPATICLLGLGSTILIRPRKNSRKRRNG